MGQWLLFPDVDDYIIGRLSRGSRLQGIVRGNCRNPIVRGRLFEEVVWPRDDTANLADIEGIDFDVINKDLVDCDDWMG